MSLHLRLSALEQIGSRTPEASVVTPIPKLTEAFGEDVFGDQQLSAKLHKNTYAAYRKSVETGAPLDREVADQIASAMREWAMAKGATHFTHWFQPLTGLTAEKHDSFIAFTGSTFNRTILMNFTGGQLIQGEPDASSFPSGGIRSTFEARGYTVWDMNSPVFLRYAANGKFLVIPTAFCSWTGESLDLKTPLLRSNEAISRTTIRLLNLVNKDNEATSAASSLGVEQEFFTIDNAFFKARPDLQLTGRTLLGAKPARGQEMEDHYFGYMDRRVLAFIQDTEWTLWKLGVPVTTRHNEVAPSQYEIAPIFESIVTATDHNLLMMQILTEKAKEHGLSVLLHEKPFAGVNGSGKHHNWSIGTNTGDNMIEPGKTPLENSQFLLFLAAVVRAVSLYGDLLRSAIANPPNDHRLGANEAPPAIISVYTGDLLAKVIEELTSDKSKKAVTRGPSIQQLGTMTLPSIVKDQSDRNRTSAFAFTGNKFEFRAVGSSQSPGRPSMTLNTIIAESIDKIADQLEDLIKAGTAVPAAIEQVVIKNLKEHKRAVFNGNGYSQEWVDEAAKRGLPNLRSVPEAVQVLTDEKNIKIFEDMKVLSRTEVQSHQTIMYEDYIKTLNIEGCCLLNLATTTVLPAAFDYKHKLLATVNKESPAQAEFLKTVDDAVSNLLTANATLKKALSDADHSEGDLHKHAIHMRDKVLGEGMDSVRKACDTLEDLIDDKLWPLAKYSEILYQK